MFGAVAGTGHAPYALKDDGSLGALGPFSPCLHFAIPRRGIPEEEIQGVRIIDATIAVLERDARAAISRRWFMTMLETRWRLLVDAFGFRKLLIVQELMPWLS